MAATKLTPLILVLLSVSQIYAAPAESNNSFVVSSTEQSEDASVKSDSLGKEGDLIAPPSTLKIDHMHVKSNISNRFAHTTVISKVKNYANTAKEAVFAIVLPQNAFISGFIMEVDGKNYTAYVKEKEEAKKTYQQAIASGQSAAHVAVSARDSNRFTVSVNVEPETKAAFYLTYEELLKRENGHYELIINLHPGQMVKDLTVEVIISESRKITELQAPQIRSGNEISENNEELDPRANINIINDTAAIVTFSPNVERQKQLAHSLGTKEDDGLAGQFVVQYDVERDPSGGEVLVKDGYFVHFFSPSDLQPLPKHVIFVLDTSGSMDGRKIIQMQEAMNTILGELKTTDIFNIVEFNSYVVSWDVEESKPSSKFTSNAWNNDLTGEQQPDSVTFPPAFPATTENIDKAKTIVNKMESTGSTNIYSALKVALYLVELAKSPSKDSGYPQPLIMFLTDGEPAADIIDTDLIVSRISEYNADQRTSPIFALSFGVGADRKFLEKLSLKNYGFSRHIYEAADSALQLQNFYKQISSPLLSDIKFKYESNAEEVTQSHFPIFFQGTEIIIAGKYENELFSPPHITCWTVTGQVELISSFPSQTASSLERLWGYLTVQQLLDQQEVAKSDKEELTQKALNLSLKYSFVTSVSSLVVVKPNATNAVDTETAEEGNSDTFYAQFLPMVDNGGLIDLRIEEELPDGFFNVAEKIDEPDTPSVFNATLIDNDLKTSSTPNPRTDLMSLLPWLKDIVNANGVLSSPEGGYKLGENITLTVHLPCSSTPINTRGDCRLLSDCPQVYSLLPTVDVFIRHFCPLNEYAGVCCPDVQITTKKNVVTPSTEEPFIFW